MGDSRLGTIFVELDLDYSKFEKGQKAILDKATRTSLRVEQNWRTLGAKSDVIYKAMAAGAVNAYNMIANHANTSAAEQFRAQSAMVSKVNTLNMQMAANPLYKTLGVRSVAAIEAQKAAVLSSYNTIKNSGRATAQDLVNIERAKNAKLKALNKEMVGDHQMSMAAMTRAVLRFYAAYFVVSQVIRVAFKPLQEGIQYLKTLETAELGMAASFATGGKFIDQTTGKALEGSEALMAAQRMSKTLIHELEFENIRTIATLDQLVKAYQTALPVAMARGFDTKQVKAFTVAMVQAAGAIGLPFDQMAEEIRSLLTGAINPRTSRIATVLGLRNEDIREYENNAGGLFDFLMGKLSAYKVAGVEAQKTWAGLWSNTKDIMDQFLGKATAPLFEAIKYELQGILDKVVMLDEETQTIKWNPEFLSAIESVKSGINTAVADTMRLMALLDRGGMLLFATGKFFGNENSTKQYDMYHKRLLEIDKTLTVISHREQGLILGDESSKNAVKVISELGQVLYFYKSINKETTKYEQFMKAVAESEDSQKAADRIKKTIADLEWQLSIMHETVAEQAALNAVRSAGTPITEEEKKKIHDLTIQLNEEKEAIKAASKAQAEANKLIEESLSPYEKLEKELDRITALYDKNLISEDVYIKSLGIAGAAAIEETKNTTDELKKLREELEKDFEITPEFNFADDALSDMANMLNGIDNLTDGWAEYNKELEKIKEAHYGIAKETEMNAKNEERLLHNQLAGYSNLAGAMGEYFDEGSEARKRFHQVEIALGTIELALRAQKLIAIEMEGKGAIGAAASVIGAELSKLPALGATAILTAAAAPFPANFVAMAAMTAIVGGLIAAVGGSFSGGGGHGGQGSSTTGTVLGSDESSKSVDNTIEMLETFRDANVAELENIYQEMQDLNNNITGLANSIVRNMEGVSGATVGESNAQQFIGRPYDWLGEGLSKIPFIGDAFENYFTWAGDLTGSVAETIAGGKSRVTAEGIAVMEATISDILNAQAVDARSYYKVKRSGGLTGHTERSGPRYNELDEGTADLINKVYVGMGESLKKMAKELGFSVQTALDYEFAYVEINLKHLSAEEIQTKLSAWMSTTMDTATDELFGGLIRKYQRIDEGLMETAYRLVATKKVVLSVFEDTGQSFELAAATASESFSGLIVTVLGSIIPNFTDTTKSAAEIMFDFTQSIADSFGGLEEAYDAISNYADKFLTDAEKQQNVTRNMSDMFGMDSMTDLNLVLPETRDGFKELVKSLDITTESGLAAYTILINAADMADSYYSTIEEGAEKFKENIDILKEMNNELSKFTQFGEEGFLSGVERAILDVEEQGRSYYDELVDNGMAIDEATQKTNKWTDAMSEFVKQEMINNTTRSLTIELLQAQGKTEEALAMQREDTIKGLRDEFGDLAGPMIRLQEEIWRLGDAAAVVEDTIDSLVEVMSSFAIQSKVASIAGLTDKFEMEQVGLEFGWFENGTPSVAGIRELVGSVLSSSTTEIRDQAASFGLSTTDYLENIGFLNTGLTEMDAAIADIAASSRNASDSLRDYADKLKDQISAVESIQDLLNNIRGEGDLAPVQSMEFFENRYQQLLSEAQSGGEREVGVFTDFARKYLEFAGNYGGDYTGVAETVETDLEALQTSIAGDKTLADLYAQLEGVNARLDAVSQNTYATATGIGEAIGKSIVTLLEGFKDATLPWEDWMEETHQDFYGIMDSFKSLVKTAMQDMGGGFEFGEGWLGEGSGIDVTQNMVTGAYNATVYGEGGEKLYNLIFDNVESITSSLLWNMMQNTPEVMEKWATAPQHTLPGFASGGVHSGGFRFVGEEGPELEFTGPSRIASNNDTVKMISDSIKAAVGNTSGEQNITVVVKMGTKQFNDFTVDVLENDPEAHRQIRRVSNG